MLDEIGGESFRPNDVSIVEKEWISIIDCAHSSVHTDDIGIIVGNLANDEVTLGIKEIFFRMAAEKLINNAKGRKKLPKRIMRYCNSFS